MRILKNFANKVSAVVRSLIQMTTKNSEVWIFFFFLTTSLFLGDGKQPFVDVWWALGILTMYGVRYYQCGGLALRPLSHSAGLAWIALILYYVILTPFSDSVGYSITATTRLIEAYLVFVMFTTISSDQTTRFFVKGLLFVGVVATLASFMFLFFLPLAGFLPPMNLLYATYGHNHLADLLLFVFPVAIGLVEKKQSIGTIGLLVLFVIGMLLTFARGAWLLLVFYLLFLVWRSKNITIRRVGLFVAAATIAAFLFISLASFRGIPQKPSLLEDGRWEYWRQSIEAIKERPLFGSGPGTFYLESKRLQVRPSSYSWFAHSFPLQTTVEVGFVGLLIFLFLFYVLFREALVDLVTRKNNRVTTLLLCGTVLVFAYGFYEFTLDYTVMWLLVWAILGVLVRNDDRVMGHSRNSEFVSVAVLVVIALYYLTSIGSATALAITNNSELAFWLAPYNAEGAKEYVKKAPNPPNIDALRPAVWFHRRNPDVAIEMARYFVKTRQLQDAQHWYNTAVRLDPKNGSYAMEYVSFLFDYEPPNTSISGFFSVSKLFLPIGFYKYIDEAQKHIPSDIHPTMVMEFHRAAPFKEPLSEYLARLYYFLGLDAINASPETTKALWTISRDLDHSFSFYHAELASLYALKFNNLGAAQMVLRNCLNFVSARAHCHDLLGENPPRSIDLPPLGYYAQIIKDFPLY